MPYFIYEVHPTGEGLLAQSVTAGLYLVYARLVLRDYVNAALDIPACGKNVAYEEEEKWVFTQINSLFKSGGGAIDRHPDAIAIRCKLALLANDAGRGGGRIISWDVEADTILYRHLEKSLDAACKLSESDFSRLLKHIGGVDVAATANAEPKPQKSETKSSEDDEEEAMKGSSRTTDKNNHHCGSILADHSGTDIAEELRAALQSYEAPIPGKLEGVEASAGEERQVSLKWKTAKGRYRWTKDGSTALAAHLTKISKGDSIKAPDTDGEFDEEKWKQFVESMLKEGKDKKDADAKGKDDKKGDKEKEDSKKKPDEEEKEEVPKFETELEDLYEKGYIDDVVNPAPTLAYVIYGAALEVNSHRLVAKESKKAKEVRVCEERKARAGCKERSN